MNFTYENQGTSTFLVYTLHDNEILDSMSLGMITNNKIPGFASTMITQMNAQRYIKYNVSAKVSVRQFFAGSVSKKRFLGVFTGIVDAMMAAEDYMIASNMLVLDLDYIFANVSTCETSLICLPVVHSQRENFNIGAFFKKIVIDTNYDQTENCDYVATILNYLNSTPLFSLQNFKVLLNELMHGRKSVPQASPQPVVPRPEQKKTSNAPSSTENVVKNPPQPVVNDPRRNGFGQPPVMQPMPNDPRRSGFDRPPAPQPMPNDPRRNGFGQPPVPQPMPNDPRRNGFGQPPAPQPMPNDPRRNGFGQPPVPQPMPNDPRQNGYGQAAVPQSTQQAAEQEVSLFYLLQHYNAENAAIYKQQKAEKKKKNKQDNPSDRGMNYGLLGSGGGVSYGQGGVNSVPGGSMNGGSPGSMGNTHGGGRVTKIEPPPRGVPADFGNTVVLDGNGNGGTVVLDNEAEKAARALRPMLLCKRNNNQIYLNKSPFRIGKQGDYVDYCVADNPTVSRSHAEIIISGQQCFLVDTNSTNHTYINGEMLSSNVKYELQDGDVIHLANEEFIFSFV